MPSTQVERAICRNYAAGHRQVDIARRYRAPRVQYRESLGRTKSPIMSNQKVVIPELHRQPMTVVSSDWRLKIASRLSGLWLRNGRAAWESWSLTLPLIVDWSLWVSKVAYHQQSLCLTWNRKRSVWYGLGGIPNGARKIGNMSSSQMKANLSSDLEIRAQEFGAKSGRETEQTVWRDVSNILHP